MRVSEDDVACTNKTFPSDSAGGPDRLREFQQLKYMIGSEADTDGGCEALFSALGLFRQAGPEWHHTSIHYGIRNSTEAAVHAAKMYHSNLDPCNAVLKLDFQINSICSDKMLEAVFRLWLLL